MVTYPPGARKCTGLTSPIPIDHEKKKRPPSNNLIGKGQKAKTLGKGEGGVAGVLGGSMIFRGVTPKSETTFVKQNRKLVQKCDFRFWCHPAEQGQKRHSPMLGYTKWLKGMLHPPFFSVYSEARPSNLKPHLCTNF